MVRACFVTANVGSVFENIEAGLPIWLKEVSQTLKDKSPDFLAFHFQETGGKDNENEHEGIQVFFRTLVKTLKKDVGLDLVEGFIDSDSEVAQQYTALSNLYFVHEGCSLYGKLEQWDFIANRFISVVAGEGHLHSGKDLSLATRMQKEKFPRDYFPNFKWSRKGFLRTRWRILGVTIDLVNIHLFHDSSNLTACSDYPSPFAKNRSRTLNYVLDKLKTEALPDAPLFIFGDFNFRLNTFEVFDILRKDLEEEKRVNELDPHPFVLDAKRFSVNGHEEKFKYNYQWLRRYDFEVSQFESLSEFEVKFHPTYPFDEESDEKFMKTRCPAWCDRVLFTKDVKELISTDPVPEYNLIGSKTCMGDHKVVYLSCTLNLPLDFSDDPLGPAASNFSPNTNPVLGKVNEIGPEDHQNHDMTPD